MAVMIPIETYERLIAEGRPGQAVGPVAGRQISPFILSLNHRGD